ncbi:hypothetical protein C4546_00180 [Candidatus Parcubacteria bacterium]|nr:MAG: hypothetical protein C4546_00180 [Candidatus Parcubacteria bacterium]
MLQYYLENKNKTTVINMSKGVTLPISLQNLRQNVLKLFFAFLLITTFGIIATLIGSAFSKFKLSNLATAALTSGSVSATTGELKLAGIRINDSAYSNFSDKMAALLTKINNLLLAHPDTDLIVTHEFQFFDYTQIRSIFLNCLNGECQAVINEPIIHSWYSLTSTLQALKSLAAQYQTSMVLGTFVEVDINGNFIGSSALVINQEGKIIGAKRKGLNTTPTGTLQPFVLTNHSGQSFSVLPTICAEKSDNSLLDNWKNFKVDVVVNTAEQGGGLFEFVSEYLTNGQTSLSNLFAVGPDRTPGEIAAFLRNGSLYHDLFVEQYIVKRQIAKPDAIFVGADKVGAQAGVYSLQKQALRYFDLTADYAVGIANLPKNPETAASQGFGTRHNDAVTRLFFTGSQFLAGTFNTSGAKNYITTDGQNWQKLDEFILTSPNNYKINDIEFFKSQVYLGTTVAQNGLDSYGRQIYEGAQVWRANGTGWSSVSAKGFGDAHNERITALGVFQDHLYAGTFNKTTGAEIWRSSDGNNWSQVNQDGFGNSANLEITKLLFFQDHLYAGTFNKTTGAEIWRSSDGNNWMQVVNQGFNDVENRWISAFGILNQQLFVGTYHSQGAEIWRSPDGQIWYEVVSGGFGESQNQEITVFSDFNNQLYAGTRNISGAEIWSSLDGMIWQPFNQNGFGNSQNIELVSLAIFNDKLWASTFNAEGSEIWFTAQGGTWQQLNPTLQCADGTAYKLCNLQKQYCDEGNLVTNCSLCGYTCPSGTICRADGVCASTSKCKKINGRLVCLEEPAPLAK